VVWLNAAVPEASAGKVRMGDSARATLAAFPGEAFTGRVTAILPETNGASPHPDREDRTGQPGRAAEARHVRQR